jgi:hypothetical protein
MGLLDGTTQQEYYKGNNFGDYQFVSLEDIINQFMIIYIGEDKLIPRARRLDVAFHAQRALAELSFDAFKSTKAIEIEVPSSLTMTLPQDYVNYVKLTWSDTAGIQHVIYPARKTSNPTSILQNDEGEYNLTAVGDLVSTSSDVILDSEYKNIQVGMIVSGPYIPITPQPTEVVATSNSGSITTITIGYIDKTTGVQTPVLPTQTNTDTTLTFSNVDESIILKEKSAVVVENLDWNISDYKITANAAGDISDVKTGMLVSHDNFPIGTTVTNVSGTTIVVSNLPDTAVTSNAGEVTFIDPKGDSSTWSNYKSKTPNENTVNDYNYDDDRFDLNLGQRYGVNPQHAQVNGSFFINDRLGKIHFSSNISGKTVILDYISDSLGTDAEMKVHKLAEDAMYKHILCDIISARRGVPQSVLRQYKKDKFAAKRVAKLRLSNIKIEEITQVLRGKSKWIKH